MGGYRGIILEIPRNWLQNSIYNRFIIEQQYPVYEVPKCYVTHLDKDDTDKVKSNIDSTYHMK